MLIGILLCGHAPDDYIAERGNIDALFRDLLDGRGFSFRTWQVVDMEFPDGPEAADAWLITGSKHGVYDDLPFIPVLEGLIRDIRSAQKPLVGVCFGHQIVAQALGGRVEKYTGGWNLGWQDYGTQDAPMRLFAWHQDQVISPPAEAETLAANETCAHAILRYGSECITIQGHPEFGRDYIELLMQARAGQVPEDRVAAARTRLDHPTDRGRAADLMSETLRRGQR